jgi:hypothetical protein
MAVNDAEIAPQALSISTQCVIVSAAVFQGGAKDLPLTGYCGLNGINFP